MSHQQLVSIVVSAGGIILAAAILAAVRGAFKVAKAINDNSAAVREVQKTLAEYIHNNDTRATVMQGDIQDLKDWRLRSEATNQRAALGTSGTGAGS